VIVIGYQGIGKSTFCQNSNSFRYIDLESRNTKVRGIRYECWADVYANFALDLSSQGYTVFVSSHKQLQDILSKTETEEYIISVFPAKELKQEWLDRLEKRWEDTRLDKDYVAWKDAVKNFDDEIDILMSNEKIKPYPITDMNYSLYKITNDAERDIYGREKCKA